MQSAAKVGLLLVVFVGLMFVGYAILGKSLFGTPAVDYYAEFQDASGVKSGSSVQMAGVSIGTVTKVQLANPHLAKVTLNIKKGIQIPDGSRVTIPSSLIGLGETAVLVVPPEQLTGGTLAPGSTMVGFSTSPLDKYLPNSKETVAELTKTMAAVRKLLENQKMQEGIETLLKTSNETLLKFGALANRMDGLMAQNQSALHEALLQGTAAVSDVHRVTSVVAKLMESGKLQNNAVAIMQQLEKTAKRADDLVASMNSLINDPSLRGPASRTAENIAQITETSKAIATNAEAITKNGVAVSANAITLTAKMTDVASKAAEIEDQLKGVLEKVGGFFGKKSPGGSLSGLSVDMDLLRETHPNHWRTDIGFQLPLADSTLHFGIYDAFESNKLNIQLAKPITSKIDYRYGIYASKPAAGVDYRIAQRLSLTSDLWDINSLRLDMRARYEFGNGLVGWLGVEKLFHENAPIIGIGIRR